MATKRIIPIFLFFAILSGCGTPLNRAILNGSTNTAELLIGNGADINGYANIIDLTGHIGRVPIQMAAKTGNLDVVKLLVKRGADVNAYAEGRSSLLHGLTPLMYASFDGHFDVVKFLVEHGASLAAIKYCAAECNSNDIIPVTALSLARRSGHSQIVAYIEQALAREKSQTPQNASAPPPAPSAPSVPSSPAVPAYSLSLGPPDFHEAQHADDYAVVVGITNYQNLPSAEFAARDAESVHSYLLALGYPERNIAFLAGDHATRAGLIKDVESWLPNNVDAKSTVFFYYSGHGAPDVESGAAYLVPWDGDPEYLSDTAYPLARLYKELGSLPAKHVLVALDSCFSGAGGRSVLAAGVRPLVTEVDEGFVDGGGKIAALSASRANQVSGVLPQAGHGLFTYYLLKGLDGGALDASGHVSVQSLYRYVLPRVQDAARRDNRSQAPQLWPANLSAASDLVLR